MARPLLPPSDAPLALAELLADNTADSLCLVAAHYERLVPELARTLVSREELEEETARVIVALARGAAQRRYAAGEEPPAGQTPVERLIRAAMRRQEAEDEERTDQALAALMD